MGYAIAGLAIAAIGAGASVYSASQSGKGSGANMPTAGMTLQESDEYADHQAKLDQQQALLGLQLYPQYAQEQAQATNQITQQLFQNALNYYPQFAAAEQQATTNQRATDLANFQQNSPAWMQALSNISPAYGNLGVQAASNQASTPLLGDLNYQALTAGASPLSQGLQNSAMYQLALGGQLDPEQQRLADQSANAAWSSRGLVNSNPAVAADVLSRFNTSNQLQLQRQGFAQSANAQALQELQANRQFQTGVQQANESNVGNYRNFLVSASQAQINPILQAGMQRTDVSPYGMFGGSQQGSSPYGISSIFQTSPQVGSYLPGLTNLYGDQLGLLESRANNQNSSYAALGGGLVKLGSSLYSAGGSGGGYGGYGGGSYYSGVDTGYSGAGGDFTASTDTGSGGGGYF